MAFSKLSFVIMWYLHNLQDVARCCEVDKIIFVVEYYSVHKDSETSSKHSENAFDRFSRCRRKTLLICNVRICDYFIFRAGLHVSRQMSECNVSHYVLAYFGAVNLHRRHMFSRPFIQINEVLQFALFVQSYVT